MQLSSVFNINYDVFVYLDDLTYIMLQTNGQFATCVDCLDNEIS